jgi:hypothetical protein
MKDSQAKGTSKRKSRKMVAIEDNIYERAKAHAASKKKDLQKYVNEILFMNLEKDEFLKEWAPNFSATVGPNSIYVYDNKEKRTAEVVIKDGKLICFEHESNDCEHIHFALALPELGEVAYQLKRLAEEFNTIRSKMNKAT